MLKLCIDKFAKYDLQQKAKGKIQKLDTGIEEKTRMFNEYSARQKEATENYTTVLKRSLSDIRDSKTLSKKSDEIMSDCSLVKDYIHEYVTDIVLYKPDESWVLVIVHFVDGTGGIILCLMERVEDEFALYDFK